MNKLFIDGSCNPQKKIGVAAFLYINKDKEVLETKAFDDTSSTKLELQGFLWAIKQIDEKNLSIYTDCQNILSLLDRRVKLEENNYFTKTGKILNNHLLYKEFYLMIDKYECSFTKVKGHTKQKDEIDELFSKVDKLSRQTLRQLNEQ